MIPNPKGIPAAPFIRKPPRPNDRLSVDKDGFSFAEGSDLQFNNMGPSLQFQHPRLFPAVHRRRCKGRNAEVRVNGDAVDGKVVTINKGRHPIEMDSQQVALKVEEMMAVFLLQEIAVLHQYSVQPDDPPVGFAMLQGQLVRPVLQVKGPSPVAAFRGRRPEGRNLSAGGQRFSLNGQIVVVYPFRRVVENMNGTAATADPKRMVGVTILR